MKLVLIVLAINMFFVTLGSTILYYIFKDFSIVSGLPFVFQFIVYTSIFRSAYYIFDGLRTTMFLFGGKDESNSNNE